MIRIAEIIISYLINNDLIKDFSKLGASREHSLDFSTDSGDLLRVLALAVAVRRIFQQFAQKMVQRVANERCLQD